MKSLKVQGSIISVVVAMLIWAFSCVCYAAIPQTISYQGILKNASGAPVNGTVSMQFALYSSLTATVPLWSELQTSVSVTNGRYSVTLGRTEPNLLSFDVPYYLGIKVGTDPEMTPRQELASAPYAIRAGWADSAVSVAPGSITPDRLADSCASGQFLLRTATGWQCGTVGAFPNAVGTCVGGDCTLSCLSGQGNCDGNTANGCEADLRADIAHCGGCSTVCTLVNGVPTCTNGTCGFGSCNAGYGNCDGNIANGCEAALMTSLSHCGGCGIACSSNNITPSCFVGVCNGVCNSGWGDCNNNKQSDGCEINLNSDVSNCGSCGSACSSSNGTRSCAAGSCGIACNAGYGNCDGDARSNGCETDITSNVSNCGGCGSFCSSNNVTPFCTSGNCTGSCNAGWANCDADLRSNGCETNIGSSIANCGGCGITCSGNNTTTISCSGGVCNGACAAGWSDCNGSKQIDGCETNTSTSTANCGGCGIVCSNNHVAATSCVGSVCNGACSAGFADCNNNKQSDGCEINTQTDANNCGGCGIICPSGVCTNSVCEAPPDGTACVVPVSCDMGEYSGGVCVGGFGAATAGTICRSALSSCDVAEVCDGVGTACPADVWKSAGTVCRASAGACDLPEYCTGSSALCPADSFMSASIVCRGAVANGCDAAENCTGTSPTCPTDIGKPAGTVCRAANGPCDIAETCNGSSAPCPADSFSASSLVCRAAAGICDIQENCTGTSAQCPTDQFQPTSVVCRAVAGICDTAENCTGTNASCPADSFQPSTTVCRGAANVCDAADNCTGSNVSCPADAKVTNGNSCGSGLTCQNGVCQ